MPGRGPQTFKKRQKEQERKERQQEKMAKRLARKENKGSESGDPSDVDLDQADMDLNGEVSTASESDPGQPSDGLEHNG